MMHFQAKSPELGTLVRAEQRAEFDEHTQVPLPPDERTYTGPARDSSWHLMTLDHAQARLAAAEAQQEEAAKQKAMEEQQELKKLRQTLEFKVFWHEW